MFETFSDISTDVDANNAASDFIKNKILQTVKDPEKAKKLLPTQYYARRPLCDGGYYEQFNRDNVSVVSLKETPISRITPKGIQTSDGTEHEVDMIIFATGFDAVDGNYTRCQIKGRDGKSLKDHWSAQGATSYLGLSIPGFPNLFMITGPNGPFSNIPPAIETHVEFISDTIELAKKTSPTKPPVIEATDEAEEEWTKLCDEMSKDSLFRKTDSWIFGANITGKKNAVLFFFGGLGPYRKLLREVVEDGYKGFKPFDAAIESVTAGVELKQADQYIEFANEDEKPSNVISA
jgi:cyclohexanone monooxygenase